MSPSSHPELTLLGIVTLFNSVFNYLAMSYPFEAASVFAGNALFRAAFGAGFPLFVRLIRFCTVLSLVLIFTIGSNVLQKTWCRSG